MKIEVYKDRKIHRENEIAGVQGENKAEVLEFVFPTFLEEYEKYIEIQAGEESIIDKIENNQYELEKGITQYENIKAQIILKDLENNVVFKSNVFALKFNEALNTTEDFISNNKNILDVIELDLKEVKTDYKELEERVKTIESNTPDVIQGKDGADGKDGTDGKDGKSAYEIAVENGYEGTEKEWLASLKGQDGVDGKDGDKGDKGDAFVFSDFTKEQLASLKGEKGEKGDPFTFADFTTEQLASLKGEKGDKGDPRK